MKTTTRRIAAGKLCSPIWRSACVCMRLPMWFTHLDACRKRSARSAQVFKFISFSQGYVALRTWAQLAFLAGVRISLLVFFTVEIKIIFSWSQIGTASGRLLWVCVCLIYADPVFFSPSVICTFSQRFFYSLHFCSGLFEGLQNWNLLEYIQKCVRLCVYLFLEFYFILVFRLAHAAIISSINKPPELALKRKREHYFL